jgi:aryl-alcohol dehydrogenase-like predicted oxidoreductase
MQMHALGKTGLSIAPIVFGGNVFGWTVDEKTSYVLQPEYNLYDRSQFEGSLAELCIKEDIGVINYYSLASGFLSGKYRSKADTEGKARGNKVANYLDDKGLKILSALFTVSADTGTKPAEIALAWLMQKKGVTAPIASATRSTSLKLSHEAMGLLDKAGA